MLRIQFRKFNVNDAAVFKSLNIEWVKRYFVIEEIDELVLSHPQTEIIDKGGFIFMATLNNEPIGTFAFIKIDDYVFEFSKMAIESNHRNKGYGNRMLKFAIRFAEQHHWQKIILYSNTILENSIHLYRKYGFIEVPVEQNSTYARSNIKMELTL